MGTFIFIVIAVVVLIVVVRKSKDKKALEELKNSGNYMIAIAIKDALLEEGYDDFYLDERSVFSEHGRPVGYISLKSKKEGKPEVEIYFSLYGSPLRDREYLLERDNDRNLNDHRYAIKSIGIHFFVESTIRDTPPRFQSIPSCLITAAQVIQSNGYNCVQLG
ncbi:hypothetical protein FACS1894200_00330 [Spirochaetia bacterium]|nr:hypothetical protein FACS1894200_00330 [Spirochaetia bacterium]